MSARGGLDVVIVSYRCRALLRDCLVSLRDFPPQRPINIHVVDNASADGTVKMVRDEFPEVRLHASGTNLGFSAANNLAIREGSHQYVLALNPDTRVTQGAFDSLLELMDEHPEIGICGCKLVREDGSLDHAAKRSFPTPLSALGHFTGTARRSGRLAGYLAPEVERGQVDAVNGAFMLMRRRALQEVGFFDEGYWMYMEDLDLCYRFARAGWVTWYEPSVAVVHAKWGSSGKHRRPHLNFAFHYGMYRFYRTHYAPGRRWTTNVLVYFGICVKFAGSVVASGLRRRLLAARNLSPRT
ncbi:MAG: glycosyltransferase family 2 protein [Actinomycetota bacterium]